ncbi:AAA family ATPase [Psychromonas sp. KJ10-2]|uniref:AAA family ATPase n=1 Tax=Psychromonas sp. KJ10-2 TaxID=3391822 RepID=UPI0039B4DA35
MSSKVILVGFQKGGVGKTLTAVNLATSISNQKYNGKTDRILIIDADPQSSAYRWNQKREENTEVSAFTCICLSMKINMEIERHRPNYDYIIVDAAGRDSREMRSGMLCSDLMIMPIEIASESTDLLESMSEVYDAAKDFNPNLKVVSFLNKVPTNGSESERLEAKSILSEYPEFPLLKTMIYLRTAHSKMTRVGKGVSESSDSKAKGEMSCLLSEVLNELK